VRVLERLAMTAFPNGDEKALDFYIRERLIESLPFGARAEAVRHLAENGLCSALEIAGRVDALLIGRKSGSGQGASKGASSTKIIPTKSNKDDRPKCFNCGKRGHVAADCNKEPKVKGSGKGASGKGPRAQGAHELAVSGDQEQYEACNMLLGDLGV